MSDMEIAHDDAGDSTTGDAASPASLDTSSKLKQQKLLKKFTNALSQLLTTLHDVFESCTNTTETWLKFEAGKTNSSIQEKVIGKWHKAMVKYYDNCLDDDWDTVFTTAKVEIFTKLNLYAKWNALDESSKVHLKTYILTLNRYAQRYFALEFNSLCEHIPRGMMDRIKTTAMQLAESIKKGDTSLDDIDLKSISESVLNGMDPDDLDGFASSMPDIFSSLSSVTSQFGASDEASKALNLLGPLGSLFK